MGVVLAITKAIAEKERGAEERFKGGLAHARHIRDRAIALLQPEV